MEIWYYEKCTRNLPKKPRRIISDGTLWLLGLFLQHWSFFKTSSGGKFHSFTFYFIFILCWFSFFVFLSVSQTQYRKDREELVNSLFSAMPETLQTNFAKEMAETHSEVAHRSYFSHSHCWSRFALTWHRAQHQLLSWLEQEKNAAICCDFTEQRRSSLPPVARCSIAANSFLSLPLDFQNEATLWTLGV